MSDRTGDPTTGLTLRQQIGQLFMIGFSGTSAPAAVLDLIQTQQVGGIILFARNLRDAPQTAALIHALQMAARGAGQPAPLLIATDQENGIVRRLGAGATTFPGNMAQGAIASERMTEALARATGEELRALGITMNLAPVVDVASNPANPVIGVRAFGGDPALVARLGAAAVHGARKAGVVAVLKHFPGHGDTTTDSHLALPVVPHDLARLEAMELAPFRRGIAAGAPVVMLAHLALPALTGSVTLPATLAPEVIQGLLRERLGFDGVVMTDCLEMRAIGDTVGTAVGAVRALGAGADLVLVSHRQDHQRASLAAVRAALEQGALTRERVRVAAARVLRLKLRVCAWEDWGTWEASPEPERLRPLASAAHRRLAEVAYARATTVVRDEARLLPLRLDTTRRVLVVTLAGGPVNQAAGEHRAVAAARALADALARRALQVDLISLPTRPNAAARTELERAARTADAIVLLTANASRHVLPQALLAALVAAGRPLAGVAIGDPYDAAALPQVGAWLATYEDTVPALEAAAAVLLGERPARGRLPVALRDGARP